MSAAISPAHYLSMDSTPSAIMDGGKLEDESGKRESATESLTTSSAADESAACLEPPISDSSVFQGLAGEDAVQTEDEIGVGFIHTSTDEVEGFVVAEAPQATELDISYDEEQVSAADLLVLWWRRRLARRAKQPVVTARTAIYRNVVEVCKNISRCSWRSRYLITLFGPYVDLKEAIELAVTEVDSSKKKASRVMRLMTFFQN